MKKSYLLFCLSFFIAAAYSQPVKFNLFNQIPVLKNSGSDTLLYPFTGGINSPQFSNIDLDGDGKLDLFIFDRMGNKILTFLNKNNKYIYAPKYESMFPELNNWVVLRDYNCDGKMDIFTEVNYNVKPEPDKFIYTNGLRVIKNVTTTPGELKWLQTQNQLYDTGTISSPPSNIAMQNSDLPAIEDIDNDGDLDLLIMPYSKNVIAYFQNVSKEKGYNCDSLLFVFRDECWGHISYKVITNDFILGDASPCWRNYKKPSMHNGTTLCMYDKDNDGDKDLIYGDIGFNSLVLLTNGKTINSNNRDSIISQDTSFPATKPARIDFPAAFMIDADFDSKKDMLVTTNADEASKNRDQISFYKNTGTNSVPVFQFQRENFLIDEMIDLGGGNFPNFVDIDGDGDQDLVMSTQGEFTKTKNSNDYLVLYKNIGNSSKPLFQLSDTNFLAINSGSPKIQRIMPAFGDLTGDGKPDLLIGDLNGKMHFYQNTSAGSTISYSKISGDYFSIYGGTSAAPQLFDLNKDGKLDIVMGRKNGTLAYFENSGSTSTPAFSASPTIDSIGKFTVAEGILSNGIMYYFDGYSIPHVCDLDTDGRYEILVGSEQGRVFLFNNFENNPNRKCEEISKLFMDDAAATASDLKFGNRTSVCTANLFNDGKFELFIGNNRGGLRAYQAQVNGKISGVFEQAAMQDNFVIYPNPAQDKLFIRGNRNLQGMKYAVVNILGEELLKGELSSYTNEMNISALQPGVYFLIATDNEGHKINTKFMVQLL